MTDQDILLAAQETKTAALELSDVQRQRTRRYMTLLVTIVVLLSVGFLGEYLHGRNEARFTHRAVACLMEQQAEHRATNYDSHVQIADDLGKPLKVDGTHPPTDAVVAKLRQKFGKDCDHFSPLLVGQK